MVTLRLTDCRALTGRFQELLPLLDEARRRRVEARGDTPAGRQCLAAGLLLHGVFGKEACQRIRFGPQGKPYIPGERDFSLSHAGDYAVLALGDGPLGVDIERETERDTIRIAERFFHPAELAFIQNAADPGAAFLTVWTLKESYSKAEGFGLSRAPSSFCILPQGASGARMEGETGYHFRRYPAPDGYALSACAREEGFLQEVEYVRLEG